MTIYDGSVFDTTNRSSDRYLQVNSCGFQNVVSEYTVIRRMGRMDYHILLIVNGRGHAYHNGKLHPLKKGSLFIYAPNEEQEYDYSPNTTVMWGHFCGTIVPEIFTELDIKSGIYDVSGNTFIHNSFVSMIRDFHRSERANFANSDLLELLYNISDLSHFHKNKNNDIILPILTYINENYNKKITVSELAKKIGYSKSRFSNIFSKATGTTPIKYQNNIRLKTACEFLQSTNLTIKNIALSCGFDDPLYFSRIFKKKYGISPTEFKKEQINKIKNL